MRRDTAAAAVASVPSASPLSLRDALRALPDHSWEEVPRVALLKVTGK